jgi:hypothetical protein
MSEGILFGRDQGISVVKDGQAGKHFFGSLDLVNFEPALVKF